MENKPVLDIVIDLVYGDSGKGKVSNHLLQNGNYTHVLRGAGGNNAGHQIVVNDVKYVTHLIPCGVFKNTKSVIGSGCVLNVKSFFEELDYLEKAGFPAHSLVKVSTATHIVTQNHLDEEINESKIGTTRKGISGAYRDKCARVGIRAESIPELKPYLIDMYQEFYIDSKNAQVLCEGSQGFHLDIDLGNYPFVTSSSCTAAGFLLNGFSPSSVRKIYGALKAYDSYVGSFNFQPEGEIYHTIAKVGNEIGSTTGRVRQVNYLNLNALTKAVQMTGANELIVSKMDILQQIDCWKMIVDDKIVDLKTEEAFKQKLLELFDCPIKFSYSPKEI